LRRSGRRRRWPRCHAGGVLRRTGGTRGRLSRLRTFPRGRSIRRRSGRIRRRQEDAILGSLRRHGRRNRYARDGGSCSRLRDKPCRRNDRTRSVVRSAVLAIDERMSPAIKDDGLIFTRGPRLPTNRGRNTEALYHGRAARIKFPRRLLQHGRALQLLAGHNFVAVVCISQRPGRPGDHAHQKIRGRAVAIQRTPRHPSHLIAELHPIHTRGFPVPQTRRTSRHPHPAKCRRQQPGSKVIGHPPPGFVAHPDPSQTRIENPLAIPVGSPTEAHAKGTPRKPNGRNVHPASVNREVRQAVRIR
jgi:hypothetical protein